MKSLGLPMAALCAMMLWRSAAVAEEWTQVFQDDFERAEVGGDWRPTGDWRVGGGELAGRAATGALIVLQRSLRASALRVEYDCRTEAAQFSDMSVYLGIKDGSTEGAVFCGFGAENNSCLKIVAPGVPEAVVPAAVFETGKRYRVAAEANGSVVTLSVNGKPLAQAVLKAPLDGDRIGLYVWSGDARFDNLRVFTKQQADLADSLKAAFAQAAPAAAERPLLLPTQVRPWRPSDLKLTRRPAAVTRRRAPLFVQAAADTVRPWPVTFGVPLPKDEVWDPAQMRVVGADGNEVPAQITPVATWTEAGSLRWVLLDVQVRVRGPGQGVSLFLEYGSAVQAAPVSDPIRIAQDDKTIAAETGGFRAVFSKERGTLIEAVDAQGRPALRADDRTGPYFVDQTGAAFHAAAKDAEYSIEVETAGPIRSVIRSQGWYTDAAGRRACRYVARVHVFRGLPALRISSTWIVTEDTDSMWFRDIGLRLPVVGGADDARVVLGMDSGFNRQPLTLPHGPVTLAQDRRRHCLARRGDQTVAEGADCGGWVTLADRQRGVTLGVLDMARQWPNALDATPDTVVFHAWSNVGGWELDFRHDNLRKVWGDEAWNRYEAGHGIYAPLRQRVSNGLGFARTHDMLLAFHDAGESPEALGRLSQQPVLGLAAPEWNCSTLAFGPCHPRDTVRFPAFEENLSGAFEQHQDVVARLNPYVGFWDYGRGIPHHLTRRFDATGEVEWANSGYRANYDTGYGNPISAWLLYLRSGERRYHAWAAAVNEQVGGPRIIHWPSRNLNRELGMDYDHLGQWSFDGIGVNYTSTIWSKHLALQYYATGNERSLEAWREQMEGFLYHHQDRPPSFRYASRSNWAGNLALYYRHTWDPRVRRAIEVEMEGWMKAMRPDGQPPERHQWLDYAFSEVMEVPDADPRWAETVLRYARSSIRDFRDRAMWDAYPYVQWWAWRLDRDPWYGLNAREALARTTLDFTGFSGMAWARLSLVWLALADVPGVDTVRLPVKTIYSRPHEASFYALHEKGKATRLKLKIEQCRLTLADPQGKPAPEAMLRGDLGIYQLEIPPEAVPGAYRITVEMPETLASFPGGAPWGGLALPWYPNETPLKVEQDPAEQVKFVQALPQGGLTAAGQAWFFVPEGTASFRLRTMALTRGQALEVTAADGTVTTHPGHAVEVRPAAEQTGKAWAVRPVQPYWPDGLRGVEGRHPVYLKLDGVPPFVAASREALFAPDMSARGAPDPPPGPDAAFLDGRFGRGIALQYPKRYLVIPLGEALGRPGARARFHAAQGTLECFIRLPRRMIEGGYLATLADVPPQPGSTGRPFYLGISHKFFADLMGPKGEAAGQRVLFTSYSALPSVQAGRWYHVAVQWNLDDAGRVMRRAYLDGYPYAFSGHCGPTDGRTYWPNSFEPAMPAAEMTLGGPAGPADMPVCVDELRVSSTPRYPFSADEKTRLGGRRAFEPPATQFEPDGQTLMLFHFDGDADGVGPRGERFFAKRFGE